MWRFIQPLPLRISISSREMTKKGRDRWHILIVNLAKALCCVIPLPHDMCLEGNGIICARSPVIYGCRKLESMGVCDMLRDVELLDCVNFC